NNVLFIVCIKTPPLIHVLAIQLLLISSELSLNTTNAYLNQKCLSRKYKPGSKYEELLITTIRMFYVDSIVNQGFTLFGGLLYPLSSSAAATPTYGPKCRTATTALPPPLLR
ncbi:LOW QUALITY PROTEIN: hypothetical protein HID58_067309, partial [Brassica napus]